MFQPQATTSPLAALAIRGAKTMEKKRASTAALLKSCNDLIWENRANLLGIVCTKTGVLTILSPGLYATDFKSVAQRGLRVDVFRVSQEFFGNVPVILLTGSASASEREAAKRLGVSNTAKARTPGRIRNDASGSGQDNLRG
jgi:hypothetical protein